MRLLGELRHAIDNVDLSLVYQPKSICATATSSVSRHWFGGRIPTRLLGPDHFLPLVREHGLMGAVTELVLEQALDDVAGWHCKGFGVPVAVNLFAPSLGDLDLPGRSCVRSPNAICDRMR